MTFTAPFFLLAAAAAAIPVILHMINRRRAKDLPFSTLRFLKLSVQKTRRRKRIHDLLLMLLRAAVLVLIAAGLAQPTVTHLSALWGGGHTAVAMILDNSASMGTIDGGQERLTTAKTVAAEILKELNDGDQAALLIACGPTFPEAGALHRSLEPIHQMLPLCRVSYEKAELAPLLRQARKLLAQSRAVNKYIFLISDMQKVSWEEFSGNSPLPMGEGQGVRAAAIEKSPHPNPLPMGEGTTESDATKIPVVFVNCNRNPKPDVALTGLELSAPIPVAGLPIGATVQLLGASTVPQSAVVELYVDGALEQSSPTLSLSPDQRVSNVLTFTLQQGGLHCCEARLSGEDGSKYDDRRFAALEVDQGIPVAIVKPRRHEIPYLDDAYYLEKALGPTEGGLGALKITTLTAEELLGEPLADYRVIFCVNLHAPGREAAERLRAYVVGGGNLVWIAGENVGVEAYNRMNNEAEGRLLPAPLRDIRTPGAEGDNSTSSSKTSGQSPRDAWHVSFLDNNFPPFRGLLEPAELYESVLVYRQVRPEDSKEEYVRILARLDDGEPLLTMKRVEAGRVLFWGTGIHVGWTNFPLRKIFLPFLAGLTFHLAGVEQAAHQASAGEPLELNFEKAALPLAVEISTPSGETLRLKTHAKPGGPGQHFRYADTHQIGVYRLRVLGEPHSAPLAIAVNFDPEEADPQTIDEAELAKQWGAGPLFFADDPGELSDTLVRLREGKSLWSLFLSGVLLTLVFETFLSNRFSPKR
ncbi:MAG: BatA and WFA domain-containing protein [Pirellulales bacterium]|nr:BatA and WFA domain-containing protein [Pirellulales bacterium]